MPRIICLIGAKRTGKDTVGRLLVERHGFHRIATGDVIKEDLDLAIRARFGFSAFTEVDAEKDRIRKVLLEWGAAAERSIIPRLINYAQGLASPVVNTRVCRFEEAQQWAEAGAELWLITRRHHHPELAEIGMVGACMQRGWVKKHIHNDRTEVFLAHQVAQAVLHA